MKSQPGAEHCVLGATAAGAAGAGAGASGGAILRLLLADRSVRSARVLRFRLESLLGEHSWERAVKAAGYQE
jgi:hypothetical protein